jgi:hypothetical protein
MIFSFHQRILHCDLFIVKNDKIFDRLRVSGRTPLTGGKKSKTRKGSVHLRFCRYEEPNRTDERFQTILPE